MKEINFTNTDYNNLLEQLGPNSPASIPVEMMLEGQIYPIRLVVASNAAPKNPEIKFQHQDEYGAWFSITDHTNGNINQVFIEYMEETTLSNPNSQISESKTDLETEAVTITVNDYNNLFFNIGEGIARSAGKIYNLIKNEKLYKITFKSPCNTIDINNEKICFADKEGNFLNYKINNNFGTISEFSLKFEPKTSNNEYVFRNAQIQERYKNLPPIQK